MEQDEEVIVSTAERVAADLALRGIDPERRVLVAVEPDDWLTRGHAALRPAVAAAGLEDADTDAMICEARRDANEAMRRESPGSRG